MEPLYATPKLNVEPGPVLPPAFHTRPLCSFVILGRLPALNDLLRIRGRGAGQQSGRAYAALKDRWEQQIGWILRDNRVKPFPEGAHLFEFRFYEIDRRRNPDNIAAGARKFILDSLVKFKVMVNDGWGQVGGWTDTFSVDQKNPRVYVRVWDGR